MSDSDLFSAPEKVSIGVVGLGYVGLPLAIAFGRQVATTGLDIDSQRIEELRRGEDRTLESSPEDLESSGFLTFSDNASALAACNVYLITVPTPVDAHRTPDLEPLRSASRMLGPMLARGDVVIFESTVYPGTTEEVCVPELEHSSQLEFNRDFFVGYSPERINPGDRERRLETIVKVTSGSTPSVAEFVDGLYQRIVPVGTHRASSIRVAEACKVIENTQRDVNIALVNELAMLFHRLGIDTHEVLEAAGTKWNFLPFKPGLVGGHCIGVDPYYLTHKARAVGYHTEMVLAGRRINDAMGAFVSELLIKAMSKAGFSIAGAKVLICGLAYKENCPDTRNTRVVDIVTALEGYGAAIDVWDPWVGGDAKREYPGLRLLPTEPEKERYDAVVLAVPHREFLDLREEGLRALGRTGSVLLDVKAALPRGAADVRL